MFANMKIDFDSKQAMQQQISGDSTPATPTGETSLLATTSDISDIQVQYKVRLVSYFVKNKQFLISNRV